MAKDIVFELEKVLHNWAKEGDDYPVANRWQDVLRKRFPPLKGLPEELTVRFIPRHPDDREAAYKVGTVLDLFDGTFEDHGDTPLDEDDWIFLKNLINLHAENMDMDMVTSVMSAIVDRGGFE